MNNETEKIVIKQIDPEVKQDLKTFKEDYGLKWRGFARRIRDLLEEQGRLPDDT